MFVEFNVTGNVLHQFLGGSAVDVDPSRNTREMYSCVWQWEILYNQSLDTHYSWAKNV